MSRSESFAELAERLRKERQAEQPKNYAREGHRRPPLPAPLRLPPGDPRRRSSINPPAGHRNRPVFRAHVHQPTSWRWDPQAAAWIGRCCTCHSFYHASPAESLKLEQDTENAPP